MAEYRFTEYFEKEVLRKRPYIKKNGAFAFSTTRFGPNPRRKIGTGSGARFLDWTVAT